MLVVAAIDSGCAADPAALAEIAREHDLVVAHGAGPHVALLALGSASERDPVAYPLDVLGDRGHAGTQPLLARHLAEALPHREVVALLTQVVVDALDPAFRSPSLTIGSRLVAEPTPRDIVETDLIRSMLARHTVVVCTGSGVPVVVDVDGAYHGVEAVVDVHWSGAVLARRLGADTLLLLTGDPPSPEAAEASAWFATATGRVASIGTPGEATGLVRVRAGTVPRPE